MGTAVKQTQSAATDADSAQPLRGGQDLRGKQLGLDPYISTWPERRFQDLSETGRAQWGWSALNASLKGLPSGEMTPERSAGDILASAVAQLPEPQLRGFIAALKTVTDPSHKVNCVSLVERVTHFKSGKTDQDGLSKRCMGIARSGTAGLRLVFMLSVFVRVLAEDSIARLSKTALSDLLAKGELTIIKKPKATPPPHPADHQSKRNQSHHLVSVPDETSTTSPAMENAPIPNAETVVQSALPSVSADSNTSPAPPASETAIATQEVPSYVLRSLEIVANLPEKFRSLLEAGRELLSVVPYDSPRPASKLASFLLPAGCGFTWAKGDLEAFKTWCEWASDPVVKAQLLAFIGTALTAADDYNPSMRRYYQLVRDTERAPLHQLAINFLHNCAWEEKSATGNKGTGNLALNTVLGMSTFWEGETHYVVSQESTTRRHPCQQPASPRDTMTSFPLCVGLANRLLYHHSSLVDDFFRWQWEESDTDSTLQSSSVPDGGADNFAVFAEDPVYAAGLKQFRTRLLRGRVSESEYELRQNQPNWLGKYAINEGRQIETSQKVPSFDVWDEGFITQVKSEVQNIFETLFDALGEAQADSVRASLRDGAKNKESSETSEIIAAAQNSIGVKFRLDLLTTEELVALPKYIDEFQKSFSTRGRIVLLDFARSSTLTAAARREHKNFLRGILSRNASRDVGDESMVRKSEVRLIDLILRFNPALKETIKRFLADDPDLNDTEVTSFEEKHKKRVAVLAACIFLGEKVRCRLETRSGEPLVVALRACLAHYNQYNRLLSQLSLGIPRDKSPNSAVATIRSLVGILDTTRGNLSSEQNEFARTALTEYLEFVIAACSPDSSDRIDLGDDTFGVVSHLQVAP